MSNLPPQKMLSENELLTYFLPAFNIARFNIATIEGPYIVDGIVHGGLGLHTTGDGICTITHLNSGHAVVHVKCSKIKGLSYLETIVDGGDWTFSSPDGWKNAIPYLGKILASIPGVVPGPRNVDYDEARKIAETRE